MRKVLVRWEAQDGAVTVCADQMGEHQLLPSHLVLYNVIGVGDAAFPTISVDTLVIKKEEIVSLLKALTKILPNKNQHNR
tara:strand:- start:971 stop:1210 length:240 start_codon:yes stop_codon:yes gene_type:complete